jgi:metallophosphoesterase (TIGR00282 family)
MKILFIGDIVARPGRDITRRAVKALARTHSIDMVIANGENAAGGAGLTREITEDLLDCGIDILTSGNHIWDKREVLDFIDAQPRLIRPANYPTGAPGAGSAIWRGPNGGVVGVINVMGRVFLATIDDPFRIVREQIAHVRDQGAQVIVVDFHAETTSEKIAMGWYLDGQVTAVIGTHTHVQTADDRVLPNGTAYLTDVGMTGPHDGVIGMDRTSMLARFTTGLPSRFEPATGDPRLNGVIITADEQTGLATAIERLSLSAAEVDTIKARLAATEPAASLP